MGGVSMMGVRFEKTTLFVNIVKIHRASNEKMIHVLYLPYKFYPLT